MEQQSQEAVMPETEEIEKDEMVEKAVSLEACQYERNFGLTQCGCAT